MEGLEVQVISLSKAKNYNEVYRWDSDYYIKEYLDNAEYLKGKNCIDFIDFTDSIKKGIFDLPPDFYRTQGVPLIRTTEIKKPTINFNSTVFIEEEINLENDKTILFPYDLVFTKIGAYIGDVAILPTKYDSYNFSQNVAGARLKNSLNGPYLISFFLSKYGKRQVLRSQMLSGQGKLELEDIRKYQIPIVSDDFKKSLKNLLDSSFDKDLQTENNYSNVTFQLLAHLGLSNWQPTEESKAIKKFSQSFALSGRLDAEYYQPKFEEMENILINYGFLYLKDIARNITTGFPYDSSRFSESEGIDLIRINNLSKNDIDLSNAVKIPFADAALSPKDKVEKGDVLISMSGTIGLTAYIRNNITAFVNQRIMKIKPINYDGDVLALIINSIIGKMQLDRVGTGGVQTNLSNSDILNIKIPILPMDTQKELVNQIQQSFKLRQESSKLIDIAKQAVEIAIEQDEQTAMKFIKDNT